VRILVTGGAGFIGSNYVRYVLAHSADDVVVLDKLTYAGNLDNLKGLEGDPRYRFVHGDIADPEVVAEAVTSVDAIVNFAAESHVDRSILDPSGFITTDVYGPYVLLEASRSAGIQRFVQVSTDEVYGDVPEGSSPEDAPLHPRSPYSASKAGGELLVHAYYVTYGVPTLVTRGSNTFGPFQYPEKLIPVVITEALDHHAIPVYGDGRQVRDWLYVEDHCSGIDRVLRDGTPGEAYNVGGGNERHNIEVIERIIDALQRPRSLIQYVPDRPGHDVRYSVDSSKLHALGWNPARSFEETLEATVRWYVENEWWWRPVKESRDYLEYFQRNYGDRSALTKRREP
jgi:dTDP-glucose 4,6-dehydratase